MSTVNTETEKSSATGPQGRNEALVMYRPNITGCTDGNCIFVDNSKGMHTNGGCQCERELRRHPQGLKAIQTIWFLRNQITVTRKRNDEV